MIVVIGIATSGRPEILQQNIENICLQTRLPDRILICPSSDQDIAGTDFAAFPVAVEIIYGGKGLPHQRNAIISAAGDADLVIFFDDDFFPATDYVTACEQLFEACPDVCVATGLVLLDGVNGPGISASEARLHLASVGPVEDCTRPTYGAYGCNMALRMAPVRRHDKRFDENLPLYGWQEDIDMSRQLSGYGRIVQHFAMRGVHLGHKKGRTSGVRLGYSQVSNAWYLFKKGTLSAKFAGNLAVRNVLANVVRSFSPEPWVDRRGRLKGNILAIADIFRGRSHPLRVLDL